MRSGAKLPEADECFENNAYIICLLSILPSLLMHQNTLQLFQEAGGGQVPPALPMPASIHDTQDANK